jgi:hypothetical protein
MVMRLPPALPGMPLPRESSRSAEGEMGREPPAPICADDSLRARSCLARKPGDVCQLMFRVLGREKELTLVVDLACGFDEVLKVGTCEEVTQVDKLAVPLILDVDGTPAVLAGGDVAAVSILAKSSSKLSKLSTQLTRQC